MDTSPPFPDHRIMSNVEPARHALYDRLEKVLGRDHADTLMTHLPSSHVTELATREDISRLEDRFDRLEERSDQHIRLLVTPVLGAMTALTAIFSFVVSVLT